jgi:hypothetical protein
MNPPLINVPDDRVPDQEALVLSSMFFFATYLYFVAPYTQRLAHFQNVDSPYHATRQPASLNPPTEHSTSSYNVYSDHES